MDLPSLHSGKADRQAQDDRRAQDDRLAQDHRLAQDDLFIHNGYCHTEFIEVWHPLSGEELSKFDHMGMHV